jgi:hypothetical protein
MTAKALDYLARAQRCEERAQKTRDPNHREWEMTLARAFQKLAQAKMELLAEAHRRHRNQNLSSNLATPPKRGLGP